MPRHLLPALLSPKLVLFFNLPCPPDVQDTNPFIAQNSADQEMTVASSGILFAAHQDAVILLNEAEQSQDAGSKGWRLGDFPVQHAPFRMEKRGEKGTDLFIEP
ncbi:MAG: hypothetical protein WCP58_02210 [bacterium]